MIQHGEVVSFGNRGYGFLLLDCAHVNIGNRCTEKHENVFFHMDRIRFTEPGLRETRFHHDPEFGIELLAEPAPGDRLVAEVVLTPRGFVALNWTFEALWRETDRLIQKSHAAAYSGSQRAA